MNNSVDELRIENIRTLLRTLTDFAVYDMRCFLFQSEMLLNSVYLLVANRGGGGRGRLVYYCVRLVF
jgi:hypothetical protein